MIRFLVVRIMSADSERNVSRESKRGKWKSLGRGKSYRPQNGTSNSNTKLDILNLGGKFIQLENKSTPTLQSFQPHWRHYISLSNYEAGYFSLAKLKAATNFLNSRTEVIETTDELFNFKRYFVNYSDLINNSTLKHEWPTLEEDLDGNADLVMGIFGLARYDLWSKEIKLRCKLPIIRYEFIIKH